MRAQKAAEKQAIKEAKKNQPKLPQKEKKKSPIIELSHKKTSEDSLKEVRFVAEVEVAPEVEGLEIAHSRTRVIKLPARYK
jgi:FKBP-type peptidyl-prolyl cis-trans isomerase (trigger factor)